jgi:phosphatidylinositol 3-kinase
MLFLMGQWCNADGHSTLKKGRQKCKVWMGVEADGLVDTKTSSTCETGDEMDRLEKACM